MSRILILSLALIVLINISSSIPKTTAATPPAKYQNYKTFVKTACSSTKYPTMCYNSLSSYSSTIKSDPIKLCTTSLSLNIKSAKKAASVVSDFLKKAQSKSSPEAPILKDCLEEMRDTVDELKQAVTEMRSLGTGGVSKAKRLENVRTYVSSAMTDETTCTDEFEEGEVNAETKKKVTKAVTELSRATSNTLALVTKYQSDY